MLPAIAAILEADRIAPVRRWHTAKRIFERLRNEQRLPAGLGEVIAPLASDATRQLSGETVRVDGGS